MATKREALVKLLLGECTKIRCNFWSGRPAVQYFTLKKDDPPFYKVIDDKGKVIDEATVFFGLDQDYWEICTEKWQD